MLTCLNLNWPSTQNEVRAAKQADAWLHTCSMRALSHTHGCQLRIEIRRERTSWCVLKSYARSQTGVHMWLFKDKHNIIWFVFVRLYVCGYLIVFQWGSDGFHRNTSFLHPATCGVRNKRIYVMEQGGSWRENHRRRKRGQRVKIEERRMTLNL